jgi:hypothetical protein
VPYVVPRLRGENFDRGTHGDVCNNESEYDDGATGRSGRSSDEWAGAAEGAVLEAEGVTADRLQKCAERYASEIMNGHILYSTFQKLKYETECFRHAIGILRASPDFTKSHQFEAFAGTLYSTLRRMNTAHSFVLTIEALHFVCTTLRL